MSCETRTSPLLPLGLLEQQRRQPILADWAPLLLAFVPGKPLRRAGFTLIELLTVITIMAILATLLLTTLSSVKRKAREAVCTSNLHQIGLALNLYLDDFHQRPPNLETLVSSKYLGDGRVLFCPADRNPASPQAQTESDTKSFTGNLPSNPLSAPEMRVSYQHPLNWPDADWNRLMQAGTRAGVVACLFHDVRSPSRPPDVENGSPPQGLVLRGLLDGTVVRRQAYRAEPTTTMDSTDNSFVGRNAGAPSAPVTAGADNGLVGNLTPIPWELFSDEAPPESGL